jgi:hypothetical protein
MESCSLYIRLSLCKFWWILNIGKVTVWNFKVWVIEIQWKFKMAEGPLVSVQHRSTAARTLATRARDSCAAAATSRPRCRPSAGRVCPSRLVLSPRRSSWEKSFAISPPRPTPFHSASSPLSAPHRWASPSADFFSIHRGCSTLPPLLPVFLRRTTGRSSEPPPRRFSVLSDGHHRWELPSLRPRPIPVAGGYATPLRSFPLRTGSKGGIVTRRTTSPPVSRSSFRRLVVSRAPRRRVGARRVRVEVLVLGVVLPVHLGRQRPRGNSAVSRAPCAPARWGRALRVSADSRLGCVGPDSVAEWAGLAGGRKASPAAPFGRGPQTAQEAGFCLKIQFLIYFDFL